MCFALRKTLRRGRSRVPLILRRMRSFLRSRPTICIAMVSRPSSCFPRSSESRCRRRRRCRVSTARAHESFPDLWLLELLPALRGSLAGLLADLLALVANALPPVRLRRPEAAELGCRLPHLLFVGPGEDDDRPLGVARDLDLDPLRDREVYRVGEAERQVQNRTLHLGAVTRADELEGLRVASGGPLDHPVDER